MRRPEVAVSGIILRDNAVLMIKRGHEPAKGWWSVPGGHVEWGESVQDALIREIREECNIAIKPVRLFSIVEAIDQHNPPNYHYILLDYIAEYISGEPRIGSDADDIGWFTESALKKMKVVPSVMRSLESYFQGDSFFINL